MKPVLLLALALVPPAAAPAPTVLAALGFDQECHECRPAYTTPPDPLGWGMAGCPFNCQEQSCNRPVLCGSVVAGSCLVIESKNHDCVQQGTYTGVSQCNNCEAAVSVVCPPGEVACQVSTSLTPVVVPDCKSDEREHPCEEGS